MSNWRYRRNGDRIHKSHCRFGDSKHSVPWNFAEGMHPDRVRQVVREVSWLMLCKRCWKVRA